MQKLPEPYRGSQIDTHVQRAELHVVHHTPPPSKPLMGFAGWLVAIGVLAPFSPSLAFVFAICSFALLIVANQVGWAWVRRS